MFEVLKKPIQKRNIDTNSHVKAGNQLSKDLKPMMDHNIYKKKFLIT